MNLIPRPVTRAYGRTVLRTKKNSPHILFGAGMAGVVGGTVLACRSTLQLEEHLDEFKADIEKVKEDSAAIEPKLTHVYVKHMARIGKLYAPALVVGGAGIACLSGAHVQLTRRNGVLTAAYAGLLKAYDEYRHRVREEVGEDKEMELHLGAVEETTGTGKNQLTNVVIDSNKLSLHARIFDEYNKNFRNDAEWNLTFLRAQQYYFNGLLQMRGHVFLNEVYEALGFEHSRAGALCGWVVTKDSTNHIDFGLYTPRSSRFINGNERAVVLDFNVDGIIYDKI